MGTPIDGVVAPGFEKVRDAFINNFEEHGDVGAAFSLHVEGRKVVDLWGGRTTPDGKQPYGEDALQLVFSTTKGATAACAHLLASRGQLDIDAPVASYWPEFAQAGKADLPVRYLLCHKAGLPTIDAQLSLEEALAWKPVIEALELQAPLWQPGTAHGYHALTYGWLVGEVVRRIDGRSLGAFFHDEFAVPLGLEFWIGLPSSQEGRVVTLLDDLIPQADNPEIKALIDQFIGPQTLIGQALTLNGTFAEPGCFNLPAVHAGELGAAGGITNARSLSRFYAGLIGVVDGGPAGPLLPAGQVEQARTVQASGPDRVLSIPGVPKIDTTFGLGFMTTSTFSAFGGAGAFGHYGAGGSVGFADPENMIAAGYVMNKMTQNLNGDPRTSGLIRASYEAVGAPITLV